MTPEESRQQRIDDYLLGHASADERRTLEAERAADAALDQELRESQLALDAIELGADRDLKARLAKLDARFTGAAAGAGGSGERTGGATIRNLDASKDGAKIIALPERRKRTAAPARRWLALAAALLLLLSVGYFLLQPGTGTGGDADLLALAETAEPYPNIAYNLSRAGGEEDPEAAAFERYEAGAYEQAADLFATLPPSPTNQFYLAQSLLAEGRYPEAASVLAPLTTASDFNLAPEAQYYLAIAYLGAGQAAEARTALQRVVDTPNHPNTSEATELLGKLR